MESLFITIFLDEEEFELFFLVHLPARRYIEEDRIETELETVFPLLQFLIVGSLPVEAVESTSRLIVRDDETVIGKDLDSVDLPSELYRLGIFSKPYSSIGYTEVVLELELSI